MALGDVWYPRRKTARSAGPGRGGAARRAHTARKRGLGAGFRAPRGRLAETKLSNRRGVRHRPWLGRGRGGLLLSPDWWMEGAYHRRLPPPEPFAGFHSLDPEPPLDFHLLWRENNPLLPLIGFVVEGGIEFSSSHFSCPLTASPQPQPPRRKERGRVKNSWSACGARPLG